MHPRPTHPKAAPDFVRRALLVSACMLLAAPAGAATYYVSPGGSDSNTGFSGSPWRTVAKANAVLRAGDACIIMAGTYTDPIQPSANGTPAARISYIGSLTSPSTVSVGPLYIDKAWVTVKGVRVTGATELYYTSESAKAMYDSVAWCVLSSSVNFEGAKYCMVARNTIGGPVAFMMNNMYAGPPGTINAAYDTLRGNVINIGVIGNKGFQLRGFTQYCLVDSNRVSAQFAVANGGDVQGRYLYNAYYNTFRDNSWRLEADGGLVGGQYTGFALRDSSAYNVFERDSMLCGVQSGYEIGGRLVNAGNSAWVGQCVGNRWSGCFFQTTGYVFNADLLNGSIIENTVFASNQNYPLDLLGSVQNTIIRNCTFFAWTTPALRVEGDIRLGGNQFVSNIFCVDSVAACLTGRPVVFHGYATGFTEDNNLFFSRTAAPGVTAVNQSLYWASSACSAPGPGTAWANLTGNDTHSAFGDPLFVDTRWATFDPHLRTGSAAIGLGAGGGDAGAYPFVAAGPDVTPPAGVTDLAAAQVGKDNVVLTWTAPGDDGMAGAVTSYDLRWSTSPITAASFPSANPVSPAPAIRPGGSPQSYAILGLTASTTYYFALRATDDAGNVSVLSNVFTATTPATDTIPPARTLDLRSP